MARRSNANKIEGDKRRSTIYDVARAAEVSAGTVSHVLNNTAPISEDTRKRVMQAVVELDYHRNENARALRTSNSKTIGIILQDITSEYYSKCTMRVVELAQETGYAMLFVCTHRHHRKALMDGVMEMIGRRVNGILFIGGVNDEECQALIQAVGIPMIFADRYVENHLCVEFNNYDTMYKLSQSLYRQGYRKFCYFGVDKECQQNVKCRLEGLNDGLRDAGVQPKDIENIFMDALLVLNIDACYEFFRKNAKDMDKDAGRRIVITSSDIAAQAVIYALRDQNIRVPEDVSVIGFDNAATSCYVQPSISSVEQNPFVLGEYAFNLILEKIQNPQVQQQNVLLNQEIVLRDSVIMDRKHLEEVQLSIYKGK